MEPAPSPAEKLKAAVRDAQIKAISALKAGSDRQPEEGHALYKETYAQLVREWPDHVPLLSQRMQRLVTAKQAKAWPMALMLGLWMVALKQGHTLWQSVLLASYHALGVCELCQRMCTECTAGTLAEPLLWWCRRLMKLQRLSSRQWSRRSAHAWYAQPWSTARHSGARFLAAAWLWCLLLFQILP